MKTTIDRSGRLVVPKELRERLGLRPGGEVDVEGGDQEIVVTSRTCRPGIMLV
jgi:AbrB family looped-hinge helix DNA binding protein